MSTLEKHEKTKLFELAQNSLVSPAVAKFAGGALLFIGALASLAVGLKWMEEPFQSSLLLDLLFPIGLFGAAYWASVQMAIKPNSPPLIQATKTSLFLPPNESSEKSVEIPFSDIEFFGTVKAGFLLMTSTRRFLYSNRACKENKRALVESIEKHLSKYEPDSRLENLTRSRKRVKRELDQKTPLTYGLVAVLTGLFFWQYWNGAVSDNDKLLLWGAHCPALVEQGEWYRILSGAFLHLDLNHFVSNTVFTVSLLPLLERSIGPVRSLLIIFFSIVGGNLWVQIFSDSLFLVGFSGAVFGILGGYAAIQKWRPKRLNPAFKQSRLWWSIIVGLNITLPIFFPQISVACHVGGFLSGALTALWVTRSAAGDPRVLLLVASTTSALLFGQWANTMGSSYQERWNSIASALLQKSGTPPQVVNNLSWIVATQVSCDPKALELAEGRMAKLLGDFPENHYYAGTLSWVYQRLGKRSKAVALAARAQLLADDEFHSTQLAHFLEYKTISPANWNLDLAGPEATLQASEEEASGEPLTIYFLATYKGKIRGVLRIDSLDAQSGELDLGPSFLNYEFEELYQSKEVPKDSQAMWRPKLYPLVTKVEEIPSASSTPRGP